MTPILALFYAVNVELRKLSNLKRKRNQFLAAVDLSVVEKNKLIANSSTPSIKTGGRFNTIFAINKDISEHRFFRNELAVPILEHALVIFREADNLRGKAVDLLFIERGNFVERHAVGGFKLG